MTATSVLPAAHVALQQPVHGVGAGQVGGDLGDGPLLGAGERERQRRRGSGAPARPSTDVADALGLPLHRPLAHDQGELQAQQLVDAPAAGGPPGPRPSTRGCGSAGTPTCGRPRRARSRQPRAAGRRSARPAPAPPRSTRPAPRWPGPPSPTAGRWGRSCRCGRRPGRPPGWSSGAGPGSDSSLPKKTASVPTVSCLARHGWLKNDAVQVAGAVEHVDLDDGPAAGGCGGPAPASPWPAPSPPRPPCRSAIAPGGCGRGSGGGSG